MVSSQSGGDDLGVVVEKHQDLAARTTAPRFVFLEKSNDSDHSTSSTSGTAARSASSTSGAVVESWTTTYSMSGYVDVSTMLRTALTTRLTGRPCTRFESPRVGMITETLGCRSSRRSTR